MIQLGKSFHPVVLYENYLVCIFMNIYDNLKDREKTLDILESQGVIRPITNTSDIFDGCKFVQWNHLDAKNSVLKNKSILFI